MIRLFWLGLWLIVELFSIYGLQYNRTFRSPYKSREPSYKVEYNDNGDPHRYFANPVYSGVNYELAHFKKRVKKRSIQDSARSIQEPADDQNQIFTVITNSSPGRNSEKAVLIQPQVPSDSNTGVEKSAEFTYTHWYQLYFVRTHTDNIWIPSAYYLPWGWFIAYGLKFSAMFYFWYLNNDQLDFPQTETFTNYDITLLLMLLVRFFNNGWFISFWGSGGQITYLWIAFVDIIINFGLGVAVVYYIYTFSNWISFGMYLAYVLWVLFIVYYSGVFLAAADKMRSFCVNS
jgi:hypothetical protein